MNSNLSHAGESTYIYVWTAIIWPLFSSSSQTSFLMSYPEFVDKRGATFLAVAMSFYYHYYSVEKKPFDLFYGIQVLPCNIACINWSKEQVPCYLVTSPLILHWCHVQSSDLEL